VSPARTRTVESCPYYHTTAGAAGQDDRARCELLARLIGPAGEGRCHVGRDVCEACVDSFPPTPEDINYVIASLIVRITDDILESGAGGGADRRRALELREWAEGCIPVAFPDETEVAGSPPVEASLPWAALDRTIPLPSTRCEPVVTEWAVGITTAPRRLPTLEFCLAALLGAGWDEPRLFVDEATAPLPARFGAVARSVRETRIGAWPNYYLALAELTLCQPTADAYMILQDDALLIQHPGLRGYLEQVLWPGDRPGIVSLYCARPYTQASPGWYALPMQWIWGALAFIFPAELARRFLADPEVVRHRGRGPSGLAGIDILVGRFAYRNDLPVYFPTPSLVQHIGHVSALWDNAHVSGSRRATSFAGDADPSPSRDPRDDSPAILATRPDGARFVRTLNEAVGQGTHRSGWPYAIAALQPLADPTGVLLDDFIEQTFVYPKTVVVHSEPWVGIVHHPPNMPSFMFRAHRLTSVFQGEPWKQSRPHLTGVIALSEYLAAYLADTLGVPAFAVKHPTEIPEIRWSAGRYERNPDKQLIQIGWYLKNTRLLYQVPELRDHGRLRLLAGNQFVRGYDWRVDRYWRKVGGREEVQSGGVRDHCRVTAYRYDCLLAENVVALELFDSSANNVVVECIARNTPIIVNRHPAVVEYLTDGYPLYFTDPSEIPELLAMDRVMAAHEYLAGLDKSWLDGGFFRESVGSILRCLRGAT
jgi:hypothetical protein